MEKEVYDDCTNRVKQRPGFVGSSSDYIDSPKVKTFNQETPTLCLFVICTCMPLFAEIHTLRFNWHMHAHLHWVVIFERQKRAKGWWLYLIHVYWKSMISANKESPATTEDTCKSWNAYHFTFKYWPWLNRCRRSSIAQSLVSALLLVKFIINFLHRGV